MGNNSTTVSLQHHNDSNSKTTHGTPAAGSGGDSCGKKSNKKSSWKRTGMIPEPDYSEGKSDPLRLFGGRKSKKGSTPQNGVQFTEDGLVLPKKPTNPCLESSERQNLHRELMFNQKIGKSVIGQKTELQKAMEKFREDQKKKELEEEKTQNKSAFEKKLEEQANKIKLQEEAKKTEPVVEDQPEFLRVHARVCAQTAEPAT